MNNKTIKHGLSSVVCGGGVSGRQPLKRKVDDSNPAGNTYFYLDFFRVCQVPRSSCKPIQTQFIIIFTRSWLVGWLFGCFEDLRRFSDLSPISRLGSRR